MAMNTEYLGLIQPEANDAFSIDHFNENMEVMDAFAAETSVGINEISEKLDHANADIDNIHSKIGNAGDVGTNTLFGKLNQGGSPIKSIQHIFQEFSYSNREATTAISPVDPAKCIVILERLYENSTYTRKITYTLNNTNMATTMELLQSTETAKLGFWIIEFI